MNLLPPIDFAEFLSQQLLSEKLSQSLDDFWRIGIKTHFGRDRQVLASAGAPTAECCHIGVTVKGATSAKGTI